MSDDMWDTLSAEPEQAAGGNDTLAVAPGDGGRPALTAPGRIRRRMLIRWGAASILLVLGCFVAGMALGYFGAQNPVLLSYVATETPMVTNTPLATPTARPVTDTPSATPTPTVIFTALPTFTPLPSSGYTDEEFLQILSRYRLTNTYDFAGGREPGWYNLSEEFGSISLQNGYVQITAMPEQGFGVPGRIPVGIVHDFVVEADFAVSEFGSDSEYQLYGFLFRITGGGVLFYAATLTPDGTYVIWSGSEGTMRRIADRESLPEGVYNDTPGAANHVAVVGIEDSFALVVNNVVVANFQDDTNSRGTLALFVQTDSRESQLVVNVSNILVGEP